MEYFSPASETIKVGLKGDCDDFAILIASLVEATGGSTRGMKAIGPDGTGHAYAEVYMTNDESQLQLLVNKTVIQFIITSNPIRIIYHVIG